MEKSHLNLLMSELKVDHLNASTEAPAIAPPSVGNPESDTQRDDEPHTRTEIAVEPHTAMSEDNQLSEPQLSSHTTLPVAVIVTESVEPDAQIDPAYKYYNTVFGVARIAFKPAPLPSAAKPYIFENDFFRVERTAKTGWGCYAKRSINAGEHILIERPLLLASFATIYAQYDKLTLAEKKVAMSLHVQKNALDKCKISAVFRTNCFSTQGRFSGLFPIASRFNHACMPPRCNTRYTWDICNEVMVLSVSVPVSEGTELRISYGKCPLNLYVWYGFECDCGGCGGLTKEERQLVASH